MAAEVRLPLGSLGQGLRVLSLGIMREKPSRFGVVYHDTPQINLLAFYSDLTSNNQLIFVRSSRMDLALKRRRRIVQK